MRRCFALLFSFFLCATVLWSFSALAESAHNLIDNGSFDRVDSEGIPAGWYREAWFTSEGYTVYGVSEGHEDDQGISIHNLGSNDARYAQTVTVEPSSLYRLSGWIRAEDVSDAGWGANLSIEGLYAYTEGLFDTHGQWQYVTMYGETGEDQHEVTVFVRLGGYSGESDGYACFDDIRLEKVDTIPGDAIAIRWYTLDSGYVADDDDEDWEDTQASAQPFWPYLIALSVLYLVIVLICYSFLRVERPQMLMENSLEKRKPWVFIFALAASAILHYFLSVFVSGYPVDINCFLAWGNTIYAVGPTRFYATTSFCDYPPAYLYILYLNQAITTALRSLFGSPLPVWLSETVIIKLFPSLCDLGIVCLVYRFARQKGMDDFRAGLIAILIAMNPVLLVNSAAWGQVDSALAILLLLVVLMALEDKWQFVMPLYMLSVLVKPQALMLGFLGLTAIVIAWRKGDRTVHRRMLQGVVCAVLLAVVVTLPFAVTLEAEQPGWLVQKYLDTLSSYAYATVNTANLYYLFGYNWNAITNSAALAPAAVLCLMALGYGMTSALILKKQNRKLPMLEGVLNIAFSIAFVVCGFTQATWSVLGYTAMAFCVVNTTLLYLRSGQIRQLPLIGGVLFLLLYTLGIKMHERYLFPAIVLFALAYILDKDVRTLLLFTLSSITMFINEGIVLDNAIRLGASLGHLNQDTVLLANILSCINLVQIPLAMWTVEDICLQQKNLQLLAGKSLFPARQIADGFHSLRTYHPDARLHWKKIDTLAVSVVTVLYAVVGLWNLGSHKAPETPWISTNSDEVVILDLGDTYEDFSMLYYCQVSYSNFAVAVSSDGINWSQEYAAEMDQGQCFRWKYLMPSSGSIDNASFSGGNTYHAVQKLSGRYVRIRANQIGLRMCEVIFRETVTSEKSDGSLTVSAGAQIPYTVAAWENGMEDSPLYSDPGYLCDEQDTLEGEPGWYNGTYFDEIYHARTAYEHLRGTSPYETTHPPLGKVLMSWAVAIFGMNPFGWRFAGALAGILMVPVIYLLAKQLTKRTSMALLAAVTLSLDCMHYTQTRIATIDSFPVLFILLAYFFMLRFMQRDLGMEEIRTLLPDLAFSGFFMGCAVSSKWIGVYAGVGLAVLFFWTLLRHIRLARESRLLLQDTENGTIPRDSLLIRSQHTLSKCMTLCLWCILFFVVIPLTIYLLSYIPYFAYQHPQSLGDYLKLVWRAQESMLSYHGKPGLGMDHPFYSPWYEWPTIVRPMYYAMAYYTPAGTSYSIFCMGNPAIWWTGIAGMLCVLACLLYRRHYTCNDLPGEFHLYSASWSVNPAFLVISFLAQFLPWVLVPRGTYIYHYFASVPFLVLANMLAINWLKEKNLLAGRIVAGCYVGAALVLFVLLFPYASGITVPYAWLDIGKSILHVYYALPAG